MLPIKHHLQNGHYICNHEMISKYNMVNSAATKSRHNQDIRDSSSSIQHLITTMNTVTVSVNTHHSYPPNAEYKALHAKPYTSSPVFEGAEHRLLNESSNSQMHLHVKLQVLT